MWINLFALVTRYVVRVISGYEVYGKYDWIGIAMRWPAALYINMAAVYRAWKTFLGESEFATKPIVWSKTTHDIPDDFRLRQSLTKKRQNNSMRVLVAFGTRPEIIKLGPVCKALQQAGAELDVFWSGSTSSLRPACWTSSASP